jgi:hypothetical protein
MQRPHESLEGVRSRAFGRRLTLPGIEISDVESDVRPRLLGKLSKSCIKICRFINVLIRPYKLSPFTAKVIQFNR